MGERVNASTRRGSDTASTYTASTLPMPPYPHLLHSSQGPGSLASRNKRAQAAEMFARVGTKVKSSVGSVKERWVHHPAEARKTDKSWAWGQGSQSGRSSTSSLERPTLTLPELVEEVPWQGDGPSPLPASKLRCLSGVCRLLCDWSSRCQEPKIMAKAHSNYSRSQSGASSQGGVWPKPAIVRTHSTASTRTATSTKTTTSTSRESVGDVLSRLSQRGGGKDWRGRGRDQEASAAYLRVMQDEMAVHAPSGKPLIATPVGQLAR